MTKTFITHDPEAWGVGETKLEYMSYDDERITNPHECDDPDCLGHIAYQKIELFDEMLALLKETRKAMHIAGCDRVCTRLDDVLAKARTLSDKGKK